MLVVSRKTNEGIRFYLDGKEVLHIKVLNAEGNRIRIGMDSKVLRIVRDELPQPGDPEFQACPKRT